MKQIVDHISQSGAQDYARLLAHQKKKKPSLILPQKKYFGPQGIEVFAREVLSHFDTHPPDIHVVFHRKHDAQYTVDNSGTNTVTISLPRALQSTQHLQLYVASRAVLHYHINAALPDIHFENDAIHTLINSLVTKYGLGVIALNASEELKALHTRYAQEAAFSLLTHQKTLQNAVREFCRNHRIAISELSPYLLFDPYQPTSQHPKQGQAKEFVIAYRKSLARKKTIKRLQYGAVVILGLGLLLALYLVLTTSGITDKQKQQLNTAQQDVLTCTRELEAMLETAKVRDIYTIQSIANKQNECESLQQAHADLLHEYTR